MHQPLHVMEFSSSIHRITATISGGEMDSRLSYDAETRPRPSLKQQRSNHGMRSASHGQQLSFSTTNHNTARRGSGDARGNGYKARKGSIRTAVRKMFGRHSRENESDAIAAPDYEALGPAPTTRHTYHRSEPAYLLSPQPELPEPEAGDELIQRTLAMNDPYPPRPSLSRTTSPFAVQFPHSARLKPMDLGNPFIGPPNQQVRRRKTLPSMLLEEKLPDVGQDTKAKELRETRAPSEPEMFTTAATNMLKKSRRKSRSTDDLRAVSANEPPNDRKRRQETRYWREIEGYHSNLSQISGFRVRTPLKDGDAVARPASSRRSAKSGSRSDQDDALHRTSDQYDFVSKPATLKSSPPRLMGSAFSCRDGEGQSTPGGDPEMSKDIEDRVAKLEAGLLSFQRSLQRLTADRNRRTIVMNGSITTRRSSNSLRTPSLLADTLTDPLEPSSYEYEYGHTLRPSNSPKPSLPVAVQGYVADPFGPAQPVATDEPQDQKRIQRRPFEAADLPSNPSLPRSRPRAQTPPQDTHVAVDAVTPKSKSTTQAQAYTFNSLYQMLADERSARRKLENQLKSLRQEISDLHSQVNFSSSNMQSTRSSSYLLAGSSSRLQDLLRETGESSPPSSTSPRSLVQRQSGLSAVPNHVSRFSGSDSEALGQNSVEQELESPLEEYRTPREGRSNWSLAEKLQVDSRAEMF